MLHFSKFCVLFLIGLGISSSEDCPKDVCATNKPAVDKDGKITLNMYYDNDGFDGDTSNNEWVKKACDAMKAFPADKFHVEFIIGAGSTKDDKGQFIGKHDTEADRREGCAAKLLNDVLKFANFVCCNNTGGTDEECAVKQGITKEAFSNCIDKHESDQLLIANADKRRNAGIPDCHVPEFAFNGVVDRCIKIPEFKDLKKAICDIFKKGNIMINGC